MSSLQQYIERYAEVAIRVGVNLQPGQTLMIGALLHPVSLECADFVRIVAEKAYEAGAKKVYVNWEDPLLKKMMIERAPLEALQEYPSWMTKWYEEIAEEGGAFLQIYTPDPDLLNGIDSNRIAVFNKAASSVTSSFSHKYIVSFKSNWTLLSYPTKAVAAKMFPDLPLSDAMERLFNYMIQAVRADREDPIQAWEDHLKQLGKSTDFMNQHRFKKLHYRAPGTDLVIELPEKHRWISASGSKSAKGISFVANLPTEEIFTVPKRDGVNGTVRSTLPLNYGGTLIENFSLTFENGKVVHFSAEKGEEALKGLLDLDEGARFLGEVALVPQNSPIAQLNTLFYNTLYDENASCHLAIGRAIPVCLEGGTDLRVDEWEANGMNVSNTHIDFMIGSRELDIDGITATGEIIPLFRNGSWVVEF